MSKNNKTALYWIHWL